MKALLNLLAGLVVAVVAFVGVAQAQDGYRIKSGDVLRIEVLEDPALGRTALVAPDGRISMPLAGAIRVSGQTVEQVQNTITSRIAPNFASAPNVFVSIERLAERLPVDPANAATVSVYVMGEATRPGRIEVEPGTTVLQLFSQMGGFTKFAATKRIQLRRTDKSTKAEQIYGLNYKAIEAGTSQAGNTVLSDGDVIVIPQRRLFE